MTKLCPACKNSSMTNIQGTTHFRCESCSINVYHEGNGFIPE